MKGHLRYAVLKALSEYDMSGYQLMHHLEESIGWKPSPGSLYPLLNQMSKSGYLNAKSEGRKKIYHLTVKGKKFIENIIKQHSEVFIKHVRKNVQLYEDVLDEKEKQHFQLVHKHMKEGDLPVKWMTHETVKLKEVIFTILEKVHDPKKKKDVNKIIKDTTQKLRKFV